MIYITGDIHGSIDMYKLNTRNFKEGSKLTKNDYVIVCGDFGLIWDNSKHDLYWRKWLANKPWTTLFVDGNHENFNLLYEFPTEEKFGGKVHKVNDSIYHLNRGEIYTINNNKKFFSFGGAESIDKSHRVENKSWWKQEMPSNTEMEYGIDNLSKHNYKIDYIITHTCPADVFPYVVQNGKCITELERYFNFIKQELEERNIDYKWYFGHYHQDKTINNNLNCLYSKIVKLP